MPFIRVPQDKDFSIVPNSIYRDNRLNLRDIGLLTYLLHLPNDWDFSIKGLESIIPNDGRDGIAASLKRIENAGYLRREQMRNKGGTLGEVIWTISNAPLPKTDFPYTANPNTAEPNTVNPTQHRTNGTNNEINREQKDGVLRSDERSDDAAHDLSPIVVSESKKRGKKRNNSFTPIGYTEQLFGKDFAADALSFVNDYVEKYYPQYRKEPHPVVDDEEKAECAFRVLCCAAELGVRTAFVEQRLYQAAMREATYKPLISKVTSPRSLGYWLINDGDMQSDKLNSTRYSLEIGPPPMGKPINSITVAAWKENTQPQSTRYRPQ